MGLPAEWLRPARSRAPYGSARAGRTHPAFCCARRDATEGRREGQVLGDFRRRHCEAMLHLNLVT
jgi:hypothetical protein